MATTTNDIPIVFGHLVESEHDRNSVVEVEGETERPITVVKLGVISSPKQSDAAPTRRKHHPTFIWSLSALLLLILLLVVTVTLAVKLAPARRNGNDPSSLPDCEVESIQNNSNTQSVDYLFTPRSTANAVNGIGSGDFTMSVYVKGLQDSFQALHPIILSNRDSTNRDRSFLFGIHARWGGTSNKIPYMQIGGINWIGYGDHPNQPDILDGTWHHFAARRRGKSFAYFIDGQQYNLWTGLLGSPIGSSSSCSKVVVGHDLVNPSATRFVGEVEELSVWNTGLQDQDIINGIRSLAGDEPGLLAYFPQVPLDKSGELEDHTIR